LHGHIFKTQSDTEVIVHLFEEKGVQCFEYLDGMFAIAIYDTFTKELYIARDRLGEKPLYFTMQNKMFLFSSELKSIISIGLQKYQICHEAVESFFALTFIPQPLTIYKNIYKLQQGHYLKVTADMKYTIHNYWDLAEKISESIQIDNEKELHKQIRNILYESVSRRMIADVPLGAFLSGGVDSSIIVSIMAEISKYPVKTFSIRNKIKAWDESQKAKVVSKLFKTDHTEILIDNQYTCSIIDKVLNTFDEPFADSSALPAFIVSEFARKNVTVVLSGDGGDELFGGYTRYLILKYLSIYTKLPISLRNKLIRPLINALPYPTSLVLLMNKIKKIINNDGSDDFGRYHELQRLGFSNNTLEQLLLIRPEQEYTYKSMASIYNKIENSSSLMCAQYTDILVGLEADMLTKVDRCSMRASLEVRPPFLDHKLVEFCFRIPDHYKIDGYRLKAILKDIYKHKFPKGFLEKKKMGFGIPIGSFLRNELQEDFISKIKSDEIIGSGILNIPYVLQLYNQHCSGRDKSFQLWTVFVFMRWLKNNIQNLSL
jgi:asparagine synthase (glutamine-hydrolysing)